MDRNVGLALVPLVLGCMMSTPQAKDREFELRPVLGIRVVDVAPGLEDVVGLKTHRGAYVIEGNGPPTESSGAIPKDYILIDDLIIGIDESEVRSTQDLSRILGAKKPGDVVKVRVLRREKLVVLESELRASPPLIYLPADTCPIITAGVIVKMDLPASFLSGYPILGTSPVDLGGQCGNLAPACGPLQLTKQTAKRTVIDINGFDHELVGDWRAHTHLSQQACLEEKAKLEALRAAEDR